jgi:uncharacterized protein
MDLYLSRPFAFSVMTKPISSVCNLNCSYCYYLEKQKIYKEESDFRMNDNVLKHYINHYIRSQQTPMVNFVWQGGEPTLMNLHFFEKVVELQQKYANGKQISNTFQTNGTRLDDNWCRFFRQHNFLVGISIDGPEHVHNHYRLTKSGQPSFSTAMRGLELLKKHRVEFNILTVVNRKSTLHALEIYRFLKKTGSGFIQFIPVVEQRATDVTDDEIQLVAPKYRGKTEVTEWSVIPEEYGKFLITIFDEWVRHDVGRQFVQIFDVTLANWVGENPGLCVFSETCGDAMVMEYNGDLYSCDHFVYPEYKLGNIMNRHISEMAVSEAQVKFGQDKLNKLPQYCRDCEYRFACHGECPKHRFSLTPDREPGLNYLCKAYKMFFSHVHPYMQYMGDELVAKRAPANVMAWVKDMDRRNIKFSN